MSHYLMIATELLAGLILLFIVTKLLGKTQFSQITPFDFISALILGELVGNAVYDHEVKVQEILFSILIWGVLIYFVEMMTQKFNAARKVLEGEPNIVIQKGMIKYDTLKKSKLDMNQMLSLIRQQGYFSIQEVEYAILETNGMISVLPKSKFDTPTISDLNLPQKTVNLPVILILDGEVIKDNLQEAGKDEKWLHDQLAMQSITNPRDVLFAEWIENQPVYALRYERKSS